MNDAGKQYIKKYKPDSEFREWLRQLPRGVITERIARLGVEVQKFQLSPEDYESVARATLVEDFAKRKDYASTEKK